MARTILKNVAHNLPIFCT